jgi:predicted DNA-binding transcriptional regulator AlpA
MERMLPQISVQEHLGIKSSLLWDQIKAGVLPAPIKVSSRASRWPASEIAAVIRARIFGKSSVRDLP